MGSIRNSFSSALRHRVEAPHVGRLVPRPRTRRPAVLEIRVANRITEREHAIVVGEVVLADSGPIGDRAVVRIVEEQRVRTLRPAVRTNRGDERVIVPLVHEHEVGAGERRIQVQTVTVVASADPGELRVGSFEGRNRRLTLLLDEVHDAPRVARFVDADGVTAGDQVGHDAAQEVRVAVVPVGDERVAEDYDAHDETSSAPCSEGHSNPWYRR